MRKLGLFPLLSFILIYALISFYTIGGLHFIFENDWILILFWTFNLTTVALFSVAISQFRKKNNTTLFTVASHTFLILLTAETVFSIFLLIGDLGFSIVYVLESASKNGEFHFHRNLYWVSFSFTMFTATIFLFAYGILRGKYKYRVIKHTLFFDDLPAAFDGFTITQISDIHSGSFTKPKEVRKGIDLINKQKSDLFVFTGDLVNNVASEIEPYIEMFSDINAKYGKFSILGNHDYGDYVKWPNEAAKSENLNKLKENHKALGFNLLLDSHIVLKKETDELVLAGVENWGVGFGERGDLIAALKGTKNADFKILLSHDPSHWDAEVKDFPSKVNLALAGHTHGMQFGIEAFGLKWSPVKYRYKHWAGIKSENNRYLNVNRGFGFIGFSGRIGIWPEITVIKLKKK